MLFCKDFSKFVLERERKLEQERQREREKDSQADSMLSTELETGLDFMTLRSQPEPKPRVGRLTD